MIDSEGTVMTHPEKLSSIETILEQLELNRFNADQLLATVIHLSYQMNKPIDLDEERWNDGIRLG